MLKYLRNKLISAELDPPDRIRVHGVLDDDLYGIEMDVVFGLEQLEIQSISGKWHRYTTPACPLALDRLQGVKGLRVEPGFRSRIQKGLGRSGCRHFAGLLVEMGHGAREAALVTQYQRARADRPELTLEQFKRSGAGFAAPPPKMPKETASAREAVPEKAQAEVRPVAAPAQRVGEKKKGELLIDMHTHTSPASPCSSISVSDLVQEARQAGLDGLVLTDHNTIRSRDEMEALRQKHGFLVLGANEIITDQGDVLVFGFSRDVQGVIPLVELRSQVREEGGFMAAAHPFRGFLIFGAQQLGLTVEKASQREMFSRVDAVEVLNGKVTADENDFARQVAQSLGLPGLAGSDAHETGSVGGYATAFSAAIKTEADLVQALHAGDFRPVAFSKA